MGFLFKSKEEKEAEKARIEAEKARIEREKINKALKGMGLDFENYDEKTIRKQNKEDISKIGVEVGGSRILDVIGAVKWNSFQSLMAALSRAVFRQNWILIRQQEIIIRYLKEIKKIGGEEK